MPQFLTGKPMAGNINGDTFDNRRSNVVELDHGKRESGKPKRPGTKTRFKGVYRERYGWRARIWTGGRMQGLGSFSDEEAAARAYDAKLAEIHGPYAMTNARLGLYSSKPGQGRAPAARQAAGQAIPANGTEDE